MILRLKENPKKIKFSEKLCLHFFSVFLESSETYPKKSSLKCSAMISLRHHEIILLAMNNKKMENLPSRRFSRNLGIFLDRNFSRLGTFCG